MTGNFFEGIKKEQFESWLKKVVGRDNKLKYLLVSEYEEERLDFYKYFSQGLSPWQTLQKIYEEYDE